MQRRHRGSERCCGFRPWNHHPDHYPDHHPEREGHDIRKRMAVRTMTHRILPASRHRIYRHHCGCCRQPRHHAGGSDGQGIGIGKPIGHRHHQHEPQSDHQGRRGECLQRFSPPDGDASGDSSAREAARTAMNDMQLTLADYETYATAAGSLLTGTYYSQTAGLTAVDGQAEPVSSSSSSSDAASSSSSDSAGSDSAQSGQPSDDGQGLGGRGAEASMSSSDFTVVGLSNDEALANPGNHRVERRSGRHRHVGHT